MAAKCFGVAMPAGESEIAKKLGLTMFTIALVCAHDSLPNEDK